MPPSIAERAQVGNASLPAVGPQCDRHFPNAYARQSRLEDHFRGEFHAGAAQVKLFHKAGAERPHATVYVVNRCVEPPPGQRREHGISPHPVQEPHSAWFYRAAAGWEPAALHQFGTMGEWREKAGDLGEIVALIRVAHEDVSTAGGADSPHQRPAVAWFCDVDDAGALARRELHRAVSTAVVRDNDFSVDPLLPHRTQGFLDTAADGRRLVEARHNHRELQGLVTTLRSGGRCGRGRGAGESHEITGV